KDRDAEREEFFRRVTGMQDRIDDAIKQKLLDESFKKEMVKPGGLVKIEAAFEIIEDLDKKVISAEEAKSALARV
ncbi:unnamed protein product, partial [marine sediment metagenome]